MQRLLFDIDAGRVDMVVVYKIDRLTRSLADFAKLVERLEARTCSFVSVTQAFNTSSSMGRLTLNVLLSFAQFEREVTAERIRDKIAASKKKGLWMGGLAPLGYDPHPDPNRRELVVNAVEAATVNQLLALYLEHGCLNATAHAAEHAVLRSKRRVFSNGRTQGGTVFSRGQIHRILTNPVYRGLIRHNDKTWPGTHPAIIEDDLWDKVQNRLQAASARRRGTRNTASAFPNVTSAAPLLGKFRDETGEPLTPTHTQRHGRRLRYYVSNSLVIGKRHPKGWRLPAPAFEQAVAVAIADHLEFRAAQHRVLHKADISEAREIATRVTALVHDIQKRGASAVATIISAGEVATGRLRIALDQEGLAITLDLPAADLDPNILAIEAPFTCRRRGVEMKIIAGETQPMPDQAMIRALRSAHRWADMLKSGTALKDIADQEGFSESYVGRIIPLATLSPKIQDAIVTGSQPLELNLETFVRARMPFDWADQERLFGLAS